MTRAGGGQQGVSWAVTFSVWLLEPFSVAFRNDISKDRGGNQQLQSQMSLTLSDEHTGKGKPVPRRLTTLGPCPRARAAHQP